MTDDISRQGVGEADQLDARNVEALTEEIDRLRLEVAELRASRKRLVVAADADRRWIERDLHEIVRQQLVALAVNLQRTRSSIDADPAAAKELLEEMTRDVQQALDETAQLAQRIYPPLLNAGGLAAALRSAAASAGIRVSVDVPAGANYPPEVAASVYFCCLEAFEHLRGRPVTVTVREREDVGALSFEVIELVEDGARSTATRVSSDGELDRLRDRVEALDGQLAIRPGPGRGPHVLGTLPLSR
jgi:signal transduction histidine kinase